MEPSSGLQTLATEIGLGVNTTVGILELENSIGKNVIQSSADYEEGMFKDVLEVITSARIQKEEKERKSGKERKKEKEREKVKRENMRLYLEEDGNGHRRFKK
ncbi:hypothetical protein AVEN_126290-1 [Araneus ventricosus]|uniref:Uncharacterized protein n=1 Tax=Araneus ventricosus TaxID=182803 RepID=A0A4Y2GUP6_ARAVE|nr:hypothetical protein AVEN_126290-1 [Araneus ventricosus]